MEEAALARKSVCSFCPHVFWNGLVQNCYFLIVGELTCKQLDVLWATASKRHYRRYTCQHCGNGTTLYEWGLDLFKQLQRHVGFHSQPKIHSPLSMPLLLLFNYTYEVGTQISWANTWNLDSNNTYPAMENVHPLPAGCFFQILWSRLDMKHQG